MKNVILIIVLLISISMQSKSQELSKKAIAFWKGDSCKCFGDHGKIMENLIQKKVLKHVEHTKENCNTEEIWMQTLVRSKLLLTETNFEEKDYFEKLTGDINGYIISTFVNKLANENNFFVTFSIQKNKTICYFFDKKFNQVEFLDGFNEKNITDLNDIKKFYDTLKGNLSSFLTGFFYTLKFPPLFIYFL